MKLQVVENASFHLEELVAGELIPGQFQNLVDCWRDDVFVLGGDEQGGGC